MTPGVVTRRKAMNGCTVYLMSTAVMKWIKSMKLCEEPLERYEPLHPHPGSLEYIVRVRGSWMLQYGREGWVGLVGGLFSTLSVSIARFMKAISFQDKTTTRRISDT